MTNRFIIRAALSISLLAVPTAVNAQATARPMTTTRSGVSGGSAGLTLQQFQARREKKMLAADTDGDGRISKAEFIAAARVGKGDPAKRFARVDRNGDGYLDKAEIDESLAHRFHRLDADGDGVLSAQERAASRNKDGTAGSEG